MHYLFLDCVIIKFHIFIKSYIRLCFIVVLQIFHIDDLRAMIAYR